MTKKIISIFLVACTCMCLFWGCKAETNSDNILPGLTTYASYDASFVEKIGDYKNLVVTKDISCSDVEILDYYYAIGSGIMERCDFTEDEPDLDELFVKLISYSNKESAAINDYVVFDYYGYTEEGAVDSCSANYSGVRLGSDTFLDGFEEQLIGHGPDEAFTIKIIYPEEYPNNTDLEGKEVSFDITLHYIFPDLTDDVVKVLDNYNEENSTDATYVSIYTTKEEFETYARNEIVSEKEEEFENYYEDNLLYALYEQTTFKEFPEEQIESFKESVENQATSYGVSLEIFLYYCYGITTDSDFTLLAEYQVAMRGMIAVIVQNEQMKVSQEEYNNFLEQAYEDYGYESAEKLESGIGKDNLCNSILSSKVLQYLEDNVTVNTIE